MNLLTSRSDKCSEYVSRRKLKVLRFFESWKCLKLKEVSLRRPDSRCPSYHVHIDMISVLPSNTKRGQRLRDAVPSPKAKQLKPSR